MTAEGLRLIVDNAASIVTIAVALLWAILVTLALLIALD